MTRSYLVTGGAGFIGSNFVRWVLEHEPEATVTNLDAMTYAGVKATVDELDALGRHSFVLGSIDDSNLVDELVPGHDVVVNFAAESHVDRSIDAPAVFLETNVVGTGVLIDAARRFDVPRFIQVSTDEVYGSIEAGAPDEEGRLNPSSPYSASKAAADLLVRSFGVTYGYEAIITRCTNNFGPYQFPEKVLPLFITNLVAGQQVPLYGDGGNERDWLHVQDHCAALHLLVDSGSPGDIYNISGDNPLTNLQLTAAVLDALGLDESYIDYVADRPGHDRRYALDSSKLRSLGWAPAADFSQRLGETIEWYRDRQDWWLPLKPAR